MSSQGPRETTSEYFESVDLTISQPKSGHRYGAESIALAEFCRVRECDRVVELGSGSGVISLIIAARDKPKLVAAVEIRREFHDIAVNNTVANGLSDMVECVNADYRKFTVENEGMFDVAVANPPFYRAGSGRLSADPIRAFARHEINGTIEELLKAAHLLLVDGGRLDLVFPAGRLGDLKAASTDFKIGQIIDNQTQRSLGPNILTRLLKA